MTKHTASRSDITLPLLIDYVGALLPSLVTQVTAPTTTEHTDESTELLWAVQDNNARLALKSQLKDHVMSKDDDKVADAGTLQPLTLSELIQQPTPERYELACFWLPTLSAEMLQQYIPLFMRYRDLYSAHLLIALDSTIDLKAYGFTPFDILSEQSFDVDRVNQKQSPSSDTPSLVSATLWQFNLYDYKQLPNWLNADYWANPENWGKHRW
ncbi:hypothetical protein DVY93_00430 [Psychrobacter sp. CCUG 69069]|uniref:DUF6231 family protein n=1 Tax=Psychrobacter sp. CCUG 69069 TaxID=2282777 RepID=UPI001E3B14EE|nr:DUF6231 family protein [Psychrobacter sp. CCUG 69069]MCD1278233.1 hypothetical protein [Psychrobacter sp. CCUG 69069]